MAQRDSLRERYEQHKPKNNISKGEDKAVAQAANQVIEYLRSRFHYAFEQTMAVQGGVAIYDLAYDSKIKIEDMIKFIIRKGYRKWEDFDHSFDDKTIQPDGGIIYLRKVKLTETDDCDENGNPIIETEVLEQFPLVIAEVKHQGTNDKRAEEGKSTQASGNAIERLGKNLTGIKAMTHYETITPFVCFGDGCDFMLDSEKDKIVALHQDDADLFALYMSEECKNKVSLLSDKDKQSSKKVLKTIKDVYKSYTRQDDNIKSTDAGSNTPLLSLFTDLTDVYVSNGDITLFETDENIKKFRESYINAVVTRLSNAARTVRAKIFTLNEFYELNKVLIFKKDKSLDDGPFAPTSMMFRYEPWTVEEMYDYMKEIAETSFRYYTM